ncbi:hypothetical protein B0H17DRAFT_1142027 [Mycena rosella]|uniref:Uncharacterized protein n=1 Tax=Mycena rosella TaxID=1033263 RepID=A0AAD7CYA1_MYCRO|nr:hypothetical protein B0H17DRAFT_1142027 [Mycena rosella]
MRGKCAAVAALPPSPWSWHAVNTPEFRPFCSKYIPQVVRLWPENAQDLNSTAQSPAVVVQSGQGVKDDTNRRYDWCYSKIVRRLSTAHMSFDCTNGVESWGIAGDRRVPQRGRTGNRKEMRPDEKYRQMNEDSYAASPSDVCTPTRCRIQLRDLNLRSPEPSRQSLLPTIQIPCYPFMLACAAMLACKDGVGSAQLAISSAYHSST